MTSPAGTVALGVVVTEINVRPALNIELVAAACVRPTTFGTVPVGVRMKPREATELPRATCVLPMAFD
jgi:hypothetical protein